MPIIEKSSFSQPPSYMWNGHLETILPAIIKKQKEVSYHRERLTLSDGDFVDCDWLERKDSQDLVVLSHGLEGNSKRNYITNAAHFFHEKGWNVLAWNCRSCSGEMNKALRLYNHGEIGDIGEVIQYAIGKRKFRRIILVGYSMGGNILLKYLGVNSHHLPPEIKAGIAFSSPCNIKASVDALEFPSNRFYKWLFHKRLSKKIKAKALQYPDIVDASRLNAIKKWEEFDEIYSAPINGYENAAHFYREASAKNFMDSINVPVLLVNAHNDPILPLACTPVELCKYHRYIHLEMPNKGGHVGFHEKQQDIAWSQRRTWTFVQKFT